jgi:integrase
MSNKKINFTKSAIEKLPIPKKGLVYYKDSTERGLSLYITSNQVITFFVRKRINGKDERVIIGNFPEISVENARNMALKIKSEIAQGINPNQEKNNLKQEITFGELFDQFIERYSKKHKITWKQDVREISRFTKHWFKKKISTITTQNIKALHDKVGDENGFYQANRLFDKIRTMYNKAIEWGWNGQNPTKGIKKFKEYSRDRFIQPQEMPRFFNALSEEQNQLVKDYIYISLYTGARQGNVFAMAFDDINLATKEWRIPKTKNGDPLTIPLIDEALEILKERQKENKKLNLKDFQKQWVFPSLTSKSGHLEEPKKVWKRILIKAEIKDLRIHDIRRTLGSYQAITGASLPIIGKSLGHKSSSTTQIYSRMNLDPVRQSVQRAVGLMSEYGLKNKK